MNNQELSQCYLVECGDEKKIFKSLDSMLDFVIKDDNYLYLRPDVYRLGKGNNFELFLTFTCRLDCKGDFVYHEDRPEDTDCVTFGVPEYDDRPSGWLWIDKFNDFKRSRSIVENAAKMFGE